MGDLNYYLNDESYNDKQMIKELSVCIRNHRDKNLPFNKELIKNIIDIILTNSQIDYNYIFFVDIKKIIGQWIPQYKAFLLNINALYREAQYVKNKCQSRNGDNMVFLYYTAIDVIIHELTHARQNYISEERISDIYDSNFELADKNYQDYLEFHDEVIMERFANLRGSKIAYQVLSYVYPIDEIKELRDFEFDNLFAGYGLLIDDEEDITKEKINYEVIPAIDTYNYVLSKNKIENVRIDEEEDMKLYDRFYLGLKLTPEEYQKLWDLFDRFQKEESNTDSVKKLINKLEK